MILKKAFYYLIVTLLPALMLVSCHNGRTESGVHGTENGELTTENGNTETVEADTTTAETAVDSVQVAEPDPKATGLTANEQSKKKSTAAPSYGSKETLYISTYGANGKVWGHVTMNGKTGRGTIHDEDENSYSISVTRHGGELYGTDQNGRQYVFRL